MSNDPVAIARAAFQGALFLRGRTPVAHQFGDRWVIDGVLGDSGTPLLPVSITIDAEGITVASKQLLRVKGRALDATEAALKGLEVVGRQTGYRLDRQALGVRLSVTLGARYLAGMTLEGAERILDEVWETHLWDAEAVEALIRKVD